MRYLLSPLKIDKYIFLLIILFSSSLKAAQVGIVASLKAIIYADIDLKSPIGFVRRGKKVAVGSVKRRRGEILPVNVNGQVGWIKVSDLLLPSEENAYNSSIKELEHDVGSENTIQDPLDENNFILFSYGPLSASVAGEDSFEGGFDENLTDSFELSLMFQHKNPYLPVHWGLGFEYIEGNFLPYSVRSLNVKGGLSYVPLRMKILSLEFYGNITLSGDFRVGSEGLGEYKGNMVGLDYGSLLRFLPESKLGFYGGAGFTFYKLLDLDEVESLTSNKILNVTQVSGFKLMGGISYKF